MRQRLEYAAAWPFIKILGILPRPLARAVAIALAQLVYLLHGRLRKVGMRNLAMAFPEKSNAERARILRRGNPEIHQSASPVDKKVRGDPYDPHRHSRTM